MIVLIVVLVLVAFLVLWNVDLHRIVGVKAVTQNAGDAAALMAARWQGITLNLIGDLNILQAVALAQGDANAVAAISNLQARLCFTGPMIGFMGAQQAAKQNGIYRNEGFDALLEEHARMVRREYPALVSDTGGMLFPEPYAGCWEAYAGMLETVADDGVAAGPDNARLYGDYGEGHVLLRIDFYEAVAGRNWCWFYNNAPGLLEAYTSFHWWPGLPEPDLHEYVNSEIFGLGLTTVEAELHTMVSTSMLENVAEARDITGRPAAGMTTSAVWYAYHPDRWHAWETMAVDGPAAFPLTGRLKPQYDYTGADAAVRVEARAARLTPGPHGQAASKTIVWTAAAKPFGYLNEEDPPHRYRVVLPAFHDVRLIPVDASSMPLGGSYNVEWQRHIRDHLAVYMRDGPGRFECWYCDQLATWERHRFRNDGIEWLDDNSWRCTITGGGGSRGGGTRRGH